MITSICLNISYQMLKTQQSSEDRVLYLRKEAVWMKINHGRISDKKEDFFLMSDISAQLESQSIKKMDERRLKN